MPIDQDEPTDRLGALKRRLRDRERVGPAHTKPLTPEQIAWARDKDAPLFKPEVFRPHLWILSENGRPSMSIVIMAVTGGVRRYKRVELPDALLALPETERVDALGVVIRRHFAATPSTTFGATTGYLFRESEAQAWRYGVDGALLGEYGQTFIEPIATAGIGGKRFPPNLIKVKDAE